MRVWLAICLSIIAVLIDVATIAATRFGGTVRWGDVSGWVGGIGSLLAAGTAVVIAVNRNNRQDRRDTEERNKAEARALRRARRIYMDGDRYDTQAPASRLLLSQGPFDNFTVALENTGSTPIYEVRWNVPLIVHIPYTPPNRDKTPIVTYAESAKFTDREGYRTFDTHEVDPIVLNPKDLNSIIAEYQKRQTGASKSLAPVTAFNRVSFVDEDGYKLGWVYRVIDPTVRIIDPGAVRGHWALVDDEYPNNVDDAVRELFDQAPPTSA